MIQVDPDGHARIVDHSLVFPNGSVITPGGDTLLVAETFGHRIRAFALDAHGCTGTSTVWAELGEATPDGVCLDAEGALAAAIGEERGTIEDVLEPYLLANGYLERTARGRIATQKSYEVLKFKASVQKHSLFEK